MADSHGDLATKCPKCKGWVTVLFGNWVAPHIPRGRRPRVCEGSSQRTCERVYTHSQIRQIEEEKRERSERME